MKTKSMFTVLIFIVIISFFAGCNQEKKESSKQVTLTLGAYTVPKEAYQNGIIPAFKKYWKDKTGEEVKFQESYMASGAQSRTIASGFEADIAALSLEQDVENLRKVGLITHDWKSKKFNGFVSRSLVIMAVRPGSEKTAEIKNWDDLSRLNLDVIYPSPKTSGGAMWIVNAIYGSGLKEMEKQAGEGETPEQGRSEAFARQRLKDIQRLVKVMDKSGRASVTTFENGFGDVLLTYENEALLRKKQGKVFPFIIPESTILIENPIALIDKNVDKHGNREVAEAFVAFTISPQGQQFFAEYGFRSVDPEIAVKYAEKFPEPPLLFDMNYLGGWEKVTKLLYGSEGIWTAIVQELADESNR